MKKETTKRITWFCLLNGVAWVWCSYLLAYLGRVEIAEELSKTSMTGIVIVFFTYCTKALLEKRESFGGVNEAKKIRRDA